MLKHTRQIASRPFKKRVLRKIEPITKCEFNLEYTLWHFRINPGFELTDEQKMF